MSLFIQAIIICDECGGQMVGNVQTKSSNGQESYWDAKRKAKQARWVTLLRYGKPRHYCPRCVDGQTVPAKKAVDRDRVGV